MASKIVTKKEPKIKEQDVTVATKKKVVKKVVEKTEAQVPVTTSTKKSSVAAEKKVQGVSVSVMGIDGKAAGKMDLPGELFGAEVNKVLIAQAVRVYLVNQRQGNASTKTRGEVDGSSKKIYRQKGTGRARHGTLRAPIFVKGGIVFGPKPRDYSLSMPKKMRNKAFISALSAKAQADQVVVLSDLAKLEAKTKAFATMLEKTQLSDKKQQLLFVISSALQQARRAGNNIPGVSFATSEQVNVYQLMQAKKVVLDTSVIALLQKRIGGEK